VLRHRLVEPHLLADHLDLSLPAFGPDAKNTAGSPGSTRIRGRLKTRTPNNAGSEDRKRLPARIMGCARAAMTPAPLFAAEVAIIDLAMELVGVAFDRRRHHRVLVGCQSGICGIT